MVLPQLQLQPRLIPMRPNQLPPEGTPSDLRHRGQLSCWPQGKAMPARLRRRRPLGGAGQTGRAGRQRRLPPPLPEPSPTPREVRRPPGLPQRPARRRPLRQSRANAEEWPRLATTWSGRLCAQLWTTTQLSKKKSEMSPSRPMPIYAKGPPNKRCPRLVVEIIVASTKDEVSFTS